MLSPKMAAAANVNVENGVFNIYERKEWLF